MPSPGDQVCVVNYNRRGDRDPTAEVFLSKLSADKRFLELLDEKTKNVVQLNGPFTVDLQA